MKNLLKYFSFLIIAINFIACSDEPPSFRVNNSRPKKANVQIKTVTNTENINDVQPGQVTPYRNVSEGLVTISAEIQGETNEPTGSFNAEKDYNYSIIIQNTTPPSIKIDRSDK